MTEDAWFQWELLLIGGAIIVAYIAQMLELIAKEMEAPTPNKLPPITRAMIPKSIEQQALEALLRIEKLLDEQNERYRASKTPTPQAQQPKRK